VSVIRQGAKVRLREDERGFTLPEVLVVIVIMGILLAIATSIWFGVIESRNVDSATNQLVADMRLANSSATNQLTDWRVVLYPERAGQDQGPDYYLVKLAEPYTDTSPPPVVVEQTPRYFPENVKIVNIAGELDTDSGWAVAPSSPGQTRTLEFNADGAMRFYQAVSGSTCVTVDNEPENRITVVSATSRVKVAADAC
jgi:prepilin-type N-terminal cleavage/methylation domain-containing protein